jgi:DNA-binding HxlR family transcriptional regulator
MNAAATLAPSSTRLSAAGLRTEHSRWVRLRRFPPKKLTARLETLIVLFHRRWSAPILAELGRGDSVSGGAKFITLANRLGLSRDSLVATLEYLMHHDLVLRNPGYGHPMRPEYILADSGYQLAPACQRLLKMLRVRKLEDIALRKWSLPVLFALGQGNDRFSEVKTLLSRITSRALTLALKDLTAAGLVHRQVIDDYPPGVAYRLTPLGRRVRRLLERLP